MKKTQLKDATRNIRRQIAAYLSVVVIALLAVTAFLGIDFGAEAMRRGGDEFYTALDFRDEEIASTMLLTEEDLDAVRATEGVKDAEGVYMVRGLLSVGEKKGTVDVQSITERISVPKLVEGRLPAGTGECVAEVPVMEEFGLKLGDTVHVYGEHGGAADYLLEADFVIVGTVLHPDHITWPSVVAGNRYLLIPKESFDAEALDGCFVKAELLLDRPEGVSYFTSGYFESLSETEKRLETLAEQRETKRTEDVRETYRTGLEDGERELADAEKKLSDARKELDDGRKELEDGERELKSGKEELDDAEKKLADAKAELDDGERQLADAKAQLDDADAQLKDAKKKLRKAKKELEDGFDQLEDGKEMLRETLRGELRKLLDSDVWDRIHWAEKQTVDADDPDATAQELRLTDDLTFVLNRPFRDQVIEKLEEAGLGVDENGDITPAAETILDETLNAVTALYGEKLDGINQLADAADQWDEGHQQYLDGKAEYEKGLSEYRKGVKKYEKGLADFEEGRKQYEDGLAEFESGRKEYEEGVEKLEDARKQLEDGEKEYASGREEYEEGVQKLEDARKEYEELGECRWVVMNGNSNGGFVNLDYSSGNIASLGYTFSMIFVVVGALVIYATVGRIVNEQRKLVGTTKSLGFFTREIFVKYLAFGVSGTLLGAVLGILIGTLLLQNVVTSSLSMNFVYGVPDPVFKVPFALLIVGGGVLLSVVAVWFACRALLRSPATQLMQDAVPAGSGRKSGKKKEGNGGKRSRSLFARLIVRNMRTDLKRVLVTVVSVAGCCVLLIVGFTIRSAIDRAVGKQFEELTRYDGKIVFDAGDSETAEADLKEALEKAGASYMPLLDELRSMHDGKAMTGGNLRVVDPDAVGEYVVLRDPESGETVRPPDEGVLVQARLLETSDLKVGDAVKLYDADMTPYETVVAGAFENYLSTASAIVMSETAYGNLFGAEPKNNAFYVRLNGADPVSLEETLSKIPGFKSMTSSDADAAMFRAYVSTINSCIWILIAMAGMMAFFILNNLFTMYVHQKKRELTVMRVNGFTVGEVKAYVSLETVFTTALGLLIGGAGGAGMGYAIVRLIEQPSIMYVRSVDWTGILISMGVTVLFSFLICLYALRNVKRLKLSDVA